MRVMFVCTGNICRSPLAHRMLEKLARDRGLEHLIEVESSGIDSWHVGEDADPRMRKTAARHGLELSHGARRFTARDLSEYDLVFAMGRNHQRSIRSMARGTSDGASVRLFREFDPEVRRGDSVPDVPDPYYGGPEGFENVYRIVERTCGAILDAIQEGQLAAS